MAVLKKIQFGSGNPTPIAKTEVTAKSGGVMSVAAPHGVSNGIDENVDYQYELDVNVDGSTIVKSSGSLAVGTVPAANVSVAAGGHDASAAEPDGKTFVGTNVETVLGELNDKITATGNVARTYTIVDTTSTAQSLPTNVLKRYQLQETIGSQSPTFVGANIDIMKDSSLQEVYLGASTDTINATTGVITKNTVTDPQSMNFAYQLADGTYSLTKIDVSKFLTESEFGDGLSVSNTGVVSANVGDGLQINGTSKAIEANVGDGLEIDSTSKAIEVKIDSTSEKDGATTQAAFLTVGSDGVKLQGIKDEIAREIAASETALAISAQGDNYITAAVDTQNNKKINVTADVQSLTATAGTPGVYNSTTGAQTTAPVAGTLSGTVDSLADGADIASKVKTYVDGAIDIEGARSDAKNTADIKAAIEGLDNTDTASAGQVVTAVSTADGIASPTKADLAGVTLGGFTQDATATGAIASSDTLGAALNKLENKVDAITATLNGTLLTFNGIAFTDQNA